METAKPNKNHTTKPGNIFLSAKILPIGPKGLIENFVFVLRFKCDSGKLKPAFRAFRHASIPTHQNGKVEETRLSKPPIPGPNIKATPKTAPINPKFFVLSI